jgi:uncharacterized protein (TIGR00255 family)
MLKSMTAFAHATLDFSFGKLSLDIQTVNNRFLDIKMLIPREFFRLEVELRRAITKLLKRGQVTAKWSIQYHTAPPISLQPNLTLITQLKEAYQMIAKQVDAPYDPANLLQGITPESQIFTYAERDEVDWEAYQEAFLKVLHDALATLETMKAKEGRHLCEDLRSRANTLITLIDQIEAESPKSIEKYRIKITERVAEYFGGAEEEKERIAREIALFADKVDLTEEIVRFRSHCIQFLDLLDKGVFVGKTLDFLVQELLRESNTIGSKAQEAAIVQRVVTLKTEIERMREQIQNVE